jgi:hypothetical protein
MGVKIRAAVFGSAQIKVKSKVKGGGEGARPAQVLWAYDFGFYVGVLEGFVF